MRQLYEQASRMAQYPTTILIEGESGTGKDVLARFIHYHSHRSNMPLIKVSCASTPEGVLESELFGHERSNVAGRNEGNAGLLEQADKGTLWFDEIEELSLPLQAKLLRVLRDREVRRVGGSWSRVIDVRILATTNRNLRESISKSLFRADLFYRLNVGYLHIPALRKRREDIIPLIDYFMEQLNTQFQIKRSLTADVKELLCAYSFPGNVRELRNLLENLCISVPNDIITVSDVPIDISQEVQATETVGFKEQVRQFEIHVILNALASTHSVRQAAKELKISHTTLIRKMKDYGIKQEVSTARHEVPIPRC